MQGRKEKPEMLEWGVNCAELRGVREKAFIYLLFWMVKYLRQSFDEK